MSSSPPRRRHTRSRYWPPDLYHHPCDLRSYRGTYAIQIKDFEDKGPKHMFQQFVRFKVQQVYMPPTNIPFAFVRFLTRADADAALNFCRGKFDASFYKYDPQKRYIKPQGARVQQVRQEKQVPEPTLKRVVDLPVRENEHAEDSKPKRKRGDEAMREEKRVEERELKKTRVHHAQPGDSKKPETRVHHAQPVREEEEVKKADQGDSKKPERKRRPQGVYVPPSRR